MDRRLSALVVARPGISSPPPPGRGTDIMLASEVRWLVLLVFPVAGVPNRACSGRVPSSYDLLFLGSPANGMIGTGYVSCLRAPF